jgi:hypothetical protein
MTGGRGFLPVYHGAMSILLIMFLIYCFLTVLHVLNLLFGLWDHDNVIYLYEREIRYEEPPF